MLLNHPITAIVLIFSAGFIFLQCNTEPGVEEDQKRVFHALEELRIGKMEGEDEYVFGGVSHVAVGKEGEIYVADWSNGVR